MTDSPPTHIQARPERHPTRRLASGVLWSTLATVLAKPVSFLTTIWVARLLGAKGFGELGMVVATLGIFGLVASAGLGQACTKYVAQFRMTDPARAGRVIVLCLGIALGSAGVMALVVLGLSGWMAATLCSAPGLQPALAAGALFLFVGVQSAPINGVALGLEAFRLSTYYVLVQALVTLPAQVILTWMWGLQGAIAGATVSTAASLLFGIVLLRWLARHSNIPLSVSRCWQEWRVVWDFALPTLGSELITVLALWGAQALLASQPNGYRELGYYNAGNQICGLLLFMPSILIGVAMPVLAAEHGKDGTQGAFGGTVEVFYFLTMLALIPVSTALVFWGDLVLALFGREYHGGFPVLVGLVAGTTIATLSNSVRMMMTSTGYLWFGGSIQVLWAAALVLITMRLAGPMGAVGLACALAGAHVLRFAAGGHFLCRQRILPGHLLGRTWGAIAWTCAASCCAAFLPREVRLWCGMGIVPVSVLLGGLVITDRRATLPLLSRAIQKVAPYLRRGGSRRRTQP